MRNKRQKTLSFKVTEEAETTLVAIQVAMTAKLNRPVTKTDVIEAALSLLAKKIIPKSVHP